MEGLGALVIFGLFIAGLLWLFGFNFGITNEGTVTYSDCRQTITLQSGSWQTHFHSFTCSEEKTQSGVVMDGQCVATQNDGLFGSGTCATAYIYEIPAPTNCQGNSKDGVWYPYLGYDGQCYTTPQGGEAYIDPATLGTPPQANTPTASADTSSTNKPQGTQYPTGKCVTESGVQICDLSYQSSDQAGTTRTVTMQANEIICHDLSTGLNNDIQGDTTTISTDPEFCASDYGAIYIDPTINVSKYYGDIQSSGQNYTVPSTESECIWTYVGGSAAVPYIQAGSYIGPNTSYDQVHAFCQDGSNQLDIFSAT